MATETLKIVITADNKGALTSLQQTAAETDKFKMSLGDLNTRLSLLKERLNQATDPSRVAKLGGEIKNVTSQIEAQKAAFSKLGADTATATDKMGGGLQKAFSGLRNIANILPGIGLAGMFGLAFEGLASLVDEMGLFKQETESAFKILSKSGEGFVKATADVNSLNETFKLAKDGTISQKTALDEYNKTLGDALGKTDSFAVAQKNLIDKGPAFVQMMLFESAATLAYKEAAEKAFEATKIAAQPKDETTIFGKSIKIANLGVTVENEQQRNDRIKRGQAAEEIARKERIDKANKESKDLLAIANEFQDKYQAIAKLFNINITKQPTLKAEKSPLEKSKFQQQSLEYPFDEKQRQQISIDTDRLKLLDEQVNKIAEDSKKERLKDFFNVGGIKPIKSSELINYDEKQNEELYKRMSAYNKLIQEQNEYNNSIKEQIVAAQQVGDVMANVFSQIAQGGDPFEVIKSALKQLLVDLATAAIRMLAIKAILLLANPFENVGGILGKIMGGGFAKGGISEGPQGGHMELLHGTEAILTPAQMSGLVRNSMNAGAVTSMGNNSQQQGSQQGEFTLRGNDLVLALQRSNVALNLRRGN